jgi:lysine 6-dehydrogenase
MCRFWEERLGFHEERDFVLMRIKVTGRKKSAKFVHSFEMVDYFDEERNVTAMGRTTAYTALAVIKLLVGNRIERKGVVPPEILGMDGELSREIECTLKERNLKIREHIEKVGSA